MIKLLTRAEVAEMLRCSPRTVRRRGIPVVRNGRKPLYDAVAVNEYIAKVTSCEDVKEQEGQPLPQSAEPKPARPTGLRADTFPSGSATVQLAQDELKEVLDLISARKSKGRRNARSGTANTKSVSATRGKQSPSLEHLKTT
mgnify:FL=1